MFCSSVLLLPEVDNTVSSAKSLGVGFVVDDNHLYKVQITRGQAMNPEGSLG